MLQQATMEENYPGLSFDLNSIFRQSFGDQLGQQT